MVKNLSRLMIPIILLGGFSAIVPSSPREYRPDSRIQYLSEATIPKKLRADENGEETDTPYI